MTAIAIERVEARSWAEFSGDWNTIHFDRTAALRLGASEVVVHGMIPIVLAQEHVDRAIRSRTALPPGWRECKVRLKKPILRGERVQLVTRATDAGVRFSVTNAQGEAHLVGSLEAVPGAPGYGDGETRPTWELPEFAVDPDVLAARLAHFGVVFGGVSAPWVGLSAHLFGEFLARHQGWLRTASLDYLATKPRSIEELVVVQTMHFVAYDERRLPSIGSRPLRVSFVPIAISSLPEACTTEARLRVSDDEGRLLELSVGILIRHAGQGGEP